MDFCHGLLEQISDDAMLVTLVEDVLQANPGQVQNYQSGNQRVLAFFVGQVMKKSQGRANPQRVSDLLKQRLERE